MTKPKQSLAGSVIELAVVVAVAIGLAVLLQAFVVKPYKIPSGSMEPTLEINQRILVDRIGMHFSSIHVGDIVVFHPPASWHAGCARPDQGVSDSQMTAFDVCDVAGRRPGSVTFVKRVVGLPGDRLQIKNGHVYRNGKREADSYIAPCGGDASCNSAQTIVVPKGDYYMMGDNRGDSDDSRYWGPVPRSWMIGKAFFTYWPPDRIGFL